MFPGHSVHGEKGHHLLGPAQKEQRQHDLLDLDRHPPHPQMRVTRHVIDFVAVAFQLHWHRFGVHHLFPRHPLVAIGFECFPEKNHAIDNHELNDGDADDM